MSKLAKAIECALTGNVKASLKEIRDAIRARGAP